MNETIYLNRLAITGSIDSSTPKVVIEEIAKAHSIKYNSKNLDNPNYLNKLLYRITHSTVKMIQNPYYIDDYKVIARFVNVNVSDWRQKSLIESFEHIMSYTSINKLRNFTSTNFQYGQPTPENPTIINSSILYELCKIKDFQKIINRKESLLLSYTYCYRSKLIWLAIW